MNPLQILWVWAMVAGVITMILFGIGMLVGVDPDIALGWASGIAAFWPIWLFILYWIFMIVVLIIRVVKWLVIKILFG